MDAIWYGIANIMEFLFRIIKPVGMMIDWLFIITITTGAIFWLWYDAHERKGGRNFMAGKGGE
ncbi:MAG: hypothetical protein ABI772_10755 [Bacteroidota bacterium]